MIWVALSVRFMLKFYSFYYIIPIRAELVWVFKDSKMVTSSLVFWIIWIVVWIVMLLFLIKLKTNKDRLRLWIWAIIFWLVINLLFYLINPWYTLQTHPRLFMYQDWKNIINKERYFFLTEKYWYDYTLYKPFKTLDDSIDGLEFAMIQNQPWLYMRIYKDLNEFGYKNILEKYKDKTFQAYFLRRMTNINTNYIEEKNFFLDNVKLLDYLEKNALDKILVDISIYTKEQYIKFLNKEVTEKDFYNNLNKYWDNIYDIKWIHLNMFIQSENLKYKKTVNWDWEEIK